MKNINSKIKVIVLAHVLLLGSAHARQVKDDFVTYKKNGITFVQRKDLAADQLSKSKYDLKPDQALLQRYFPIPVSELNSVTADTFNGLTQEELDQIYIRLTSGPIVPGEYSGTVHNRTELSQFLVSQIIRPGSAIDKAAKAICFFNRGIKSGIKKLVESAKEGDISPADLTKCFAELAWSGKRIYDGSDAVSSNNAGEILLRNAIQPTLLDILSPILSFSVSGDNKRNLTQRFQGNERLMIFPAKVYCGQSLLDHRRESIIIDYAHGKDWNEMHGKDYINNLDDLAGPGFLNIRDEIRMVRPGLYMGRAYINKIFALNFILENKNIKNDSKFSNERANSCFDGTTTR